MELAANVGEPAQRSDVPHQSQRRDPILCRDADARGHPPGCALCHHQRNSHRNHRQPGQVLGRRITAGAAAERAPGAGGRRHHRRGQVQAGGGPGGADTVAAAVVPGRHRAGSATPGQPGDAQPVPVRRARLSFREVSGSPGFLLARFPAGGPAPALRPRRGRPFRRRHRCGGEPRPPPGAGCGG